MAMKYVGGRQRYCRTFTEGFSHVRDHTEINTGRTLHVTS